MISLCSDPKARLSDDARFCRFALPEPHYLGQQVECIWCEALVFPDLMGKCCSYGQVHLRSYPQFHHKLHWLMTSNDPVAVNYRKNIPTYNTSNSCASQTVTTTLTKRCKPYVEVCGQILNSIGPLETPPGKTPLFGQILVMDAKKATEMRMKNPLLAGRMERTVVKSLTKMFLETNYIVKQYQTIGELLEEAKEKGEEVANLCLILTSPSEDDLVKVRSLSV